MVFFNPQYLPYIACILRSFPFFFIVVLNSQLAFLSVCYFVPVDLFGFSKKKNIDANIDNFFLLDPFFNKFQSLILWLVVIKWQWWLKNSSFDIDIGEGNGTALQYSCLENPMGGGAW